MMNEAQLIILMQQHGIRPTANRIIVAKALAEEGRPLTMTELEDLPIPEVQLPDGYEMQSANFVLKGICPKCRK